VGVIESIGTDAKFTSKYGGNGCPDKSANGMFTYAKNKGCAWGTIDTLPEIPGVALRSDGHVGVYVGGGYAVEERGFNYGCVKTKVASRKWTHWFQLPFVDYGDAVFTGGSYVLNAIVSRNGETATLPAGVILRVQVYDRAPSFRLTAKGKLDVLNPVSEIIYTPRLTNAQGTVTDIRLKGADAELFAAEVVDGVVHLTMAKGCTYSTRTTYKVIPVLTFCGQEVTGSTLSIRVTQSTVKLAKLSNRTVYQSQTAPLVQVLSITSPTTAEIGEITLNSRSTAALRNAAEAAGGIEVSGGVVRFPAKAFASLKPGRYTVILDVTPENAAADAKPIQARFTLTVQK